MDTRFGGRESHPRVPAWAIFTGSSPVPAFDGRRTRTSSEEETTATRDSLSDAPLHAIVLLFIEGFLVCGFLATFVYAPEVDASNKDNSFWAHLNGKPRSLPVTYTRKSFDSLFFTGQPTPACPLFFSLFVFLRFLLSPFPATPFFFLPSLYPSTAVLAVLCVLTGQTFR